MSESKLSFDPQTAELDALAAHTEDYYKAVHGIRPRYHPGMTSRDGMLEICKNLDEYMEAMSRSERGRQQLRDEGWVIDEPTGPLTAPVEVQYNWGTP